MEKRLFHCVLVKRCYHHSMRSFSKKKIDSKTIRIISTLAVSLFAMFFVFILTSLLMEHSLKHSEKRYIESCEDVMEGYTNAIYYYLERYHTSLSSVYNDELFYTENYKKIQQWLIDNQKYIHDDMCATFYVSKDGTAYFSNGVVVDVSNAEYFNHVKKSHEDFYISDIHDSKYVDDKVVLLCEPVYKNSEFLGVLCGSLKLYLLQDITDEIKIGDGGAACILDSKGKFITNDNSEMIGKGFEPAEEKYKFASTSYIVKMGNGHIETVVGTGEVIDLFFEKIKDCDWTLTVGFYKKELNKIYSQQSVDKLLIILISIIAIIVLVFLETVISENFYKKQVISISYDSLTNLWTRQRFEEIADRLLKHKNKAIYMFVVSDIRGFKFINQNYGSEEADKVILKLSTEINNIARRNNGIAGRGFADRFYMLYKVKDVRTGMAKFHEDLDELMEKIKKSEIPFVPKFGITFVRTSKERKITIKDLIGQASFAITTIKEDMLTPYAIYNSRMVNKVKERNYIELNMEKALNENEFFVMYQPKVSLKDDKVVGAEALVRWNSPEKGILSPNTFIEIFEKNNFIQKLDFYVYDHVFAFIQKQLNEGKKVVPISVNMSRNHNKPEKYVQELMKIFNKYNIPANLVQIEIIERSVMDKSSLQDITNRLHEQGFTVAMDDFGSGESSLSMLTRVPVDVLKFDREFLLSSSNDDGTMDEKTASFISILITLSKTLDKETVFEGVETEKQRDFLRSIRCDQVQGYFYSKPLMQEDFVRFVEMHS